MTKLQELSETYNNSVGHLTRATYLSVLQYLVSITPHLSINLDRIEAIDKIPGKWGIISKLRKDGEEFSMLLSYRGIPLNIELTTELAFISFPEVRYPDYFCSRLGYSYSMDWLRAGGSLPERAAIEAGRWPTFQELSDVHILRPITKIYKAQIYWVFASQQPVAFGLSLEAAYKKYTNAANKTDKAYIPALEAKAMRLYIQERGLSLFNILNNSKKSIVYHVPIPPIPKLVKIKK